MSHCKKLPRRISLLSFGLALVAALCLATGSGWSQTLLLDFNTPGQYTGNFNNPGTGSSCTETNAGGVTNSGALLVTGGDGNATYNASSWDFSTNTAYISVSMMGLIQQATGTGNKWQIGILNGNTAGFALAATGDGWNFGSFRLLPLSTTSPTYQLAYQTATNGTTSSGNIGSPLTLTVGHWYQFNTYFTNTGPGTSYNMACSLIDYGTDGATPGANVITFSTLQTITGTQPVLSSDSTVWPGFRVANNTGVGVLDNFSVIGGGGGGSVSNLPVIIVQPASQTVSVSNNVTFSVTANNATGYLWYTNSVDDPNGTSASYTLTNIPLADNGMTIQVRVTNNYGSTNSSVATLTVTLPSTVTIAVNCASNTGAVNPYVWGVGGPDKYTWWAGNTNLEQSIQAAKITLVRIDPVQICLYNGRDPYPSTTNWSYAGLDAILNTVFDAGAVPIFTLCDFPGGVSHSTTSSGYITNADWNAYATFMSGVVNRYNVQKALGTNNTVHYWEMWNEPAIEGDGKFASQSDYGVFVQTVGNAMKATDPTIKLIGPVADHTDLSSSGWTSYTAKNLSTQIDILCWHDYGPSASGTSDSTYMGWTPLNYQTNMATVKSGDGGLCVGPGGKLYGGAITEYNMSYANNGATFDLMYHDEFDATFAASAIINAMKGGADLFAFYNLAETGGNLLGLLYNTDYSPYKPYYTFYLFGNYFGDQFVSSTGGASTLECIASKKTAAGTYTVMVVNKDTSGLAYNVNFVLTNIPSASGSVLIHKVNATTDPVSYLETAAYTNSSFSYSIPAYNVIAFEFDPPPVLQTSISNGNLIISWSPLAGRLQTTPNLTLPVWTDVTTNNAATIPIGGGNAFFRVVVP
jgi:hypothetical protein